MRELETHLLMKCGTVVEFYEFDSQLQCSWQVSLWAELYLLIPATSITLCYRIGELRAQRKFSAAEDILDYS